MKKIFEKIKRNGYEFDGKIPRCGMSYDGKYFLGNGGGWTDGFYVGVFNLAYAFTGDDDFLKIAARYDDFFDKRIQNTEEINKENNFLALDHDVGMIFLPASGFGYLLKENDRDRDILIKAADVLVERFNDKGNFIKAWDTWAWDTDENFIEEKKGKVIIDSMMNIPLLFQVAKITGDNSYYDVGIKHAHTVAKHIIREDFSTYHTYNFDYKTGKAIGGRTRQGYADESCWSRGQAWAVYGFALAYKYTGVTKFLEISKKCADYFMSHLSAVDMPCWDFGATGEAFAPWDSAAAAICASGMLEIYDMDKSEEYRENAIRLIKALEKFCLTDDYDKCQPLILHGCVGTAYAKDAPAKLCERAIGQALVYSDYFYLESKLKLSGSKVRIF